MRKTLTIEEEREEALKAYDGAVKSFKEDLQFKREDRCFVLAAAISRLNTIDQKIIDRQWEGVESYKKHLN